MSLKNLVDAMNRHETQKRSLLPENYVSLDAFRIFVPDWLSMGMGPPRSAGGPRRDLLLTRLLSGEKLSDDVLTEAFGFTNAELEACLKETDPVIRQLPDKPVLMTFDDSTIDHYEVACPVLEKYGGKAILFTTEMKKRMFGDTGFDDKSAFMTWEQIKELSDRGHEIGNHSLHHDLDFSRASDDEIIQSVKGLEERCAKYGIPKPITIGYPGGGCSPHSEKLLHDMGYLWGRGSMVGASPRIAGDAYFDPYSVTPMVVPNIMAMSQERLIEAVNGAVGSKVVLLVYHEVTDIRMNPTPFEVQVATIYENGGRCVTFRELGEYIDPVKAWNYIYPQIPEQPKRMFGPPVER